MGPWSTRRNICFCFFVSGLAESHLHSFGKRSCELERRIHSSVLSPLYHKFSQDFHAQIPSCWQHSWPKHPWLVINLWIQIQSPISSDLYLSHIYYSCSKNPLLPDTSSPKLPAPCAPHCLLVLACPWWRLCENCTQGWGQGKVYNVYQFVTVLRSHGGRCLQNPPWNNKIFFNCVWFMPPNIREKKFHQFLPLWV